MKIIKEIRIPLAPIEIQTQIVVALQDEQKIVDQNKKLIEIFEGKIKAKIKKI